MRPLETSPCVGNRPVDGAVSPALGTKEASIIYWASSVAQLVKEPTCNAGDSGSIPVYGSSLGEGIGYPLQHPWASLMAQMVKNLPAMRETWVRPLG